MADDRKRLRKRWWLMNRRCYDPTFDFYHRYGGRGIGVCDEWRGDFESFYEWAMVNGFSPELEIDREDNDLGYCPSNCRWVDKTVNGNNTSRNINVTAFGETRTVAEWSRDPRCAVKYMALRKRIVEGWDAERAITAGADRTVRSDNRLLTAFGETKTIAAWSRDPRCEVNLSSLRRRLDDGWTVEHAVSLPSGTGFQYNSNTRLISAFGETKPLHDWAADRRCVVSKNTLWARLNRGWEPEQALSQPSGGQEMVPVPTRATL